MKRLAFADASFLMMEKPHQPQHVAGLQLFDFPDDAPPTFLQDTVEKFRAAENVRPPFNQKVVQSMGRWYWKDDAHFDLEHHFRHSALPAPGRVRELLSLVSRMHGSMLDRARPLWECSLIEGLEDNRFAIYTKLHHTMADGVAAMRLGQQALTDDPNARNLPPPWAKRLDEVKRTAEKRPAAAQVVPTDLGRLRSQIGSAFNVGGNLVDMWRTAGKEFGEVSPLQAPRSPMNVSVTAARRYAAQSYSKDRVKAISKAYDATTNDVVLGMCAGALRDYLLGLNALPDDPLIAMVPVSIRPKGSDETGNAVAMILANLGTHSADPAVRMELIQASTQAGKDRLSNMSRREIMNYALLMCAPMFLTPILGAERAPPMCNVVISNVPGPDKPLYWNGARLSGMYPVSVAVDGMALNITLTSYCDQLEFGVIACRRAMPSVQRMLDLIDKSLDDLERAAGI